MFGLFKKKIEKKQKISCPYEIEPPEQAPARQVLSNCLGCRWNQGICMSPVIPRLFISRSRRLIVCIDRQPWGDLVLRQAEQVAEEAWNWKQPL